MIYLNFNTLLNFNFLLFSHRKICVNNAIMLDFFFFTKHHPYLVISQVIWLVIQQRSKGYATNKIFSQKKGQTDFLLRAPLWNHLWGWISRNPLRLTAKLGFALTSRTIAETHTHSLSCACALSCHIPNPWPCRCFAAVGDRATNRYGSVSSLKAELIKVQGETLDKVMWSSHSLS